MTKPNVCERAALVCDEKADALAAIHPQTIHTQRAEIALRDCAAAIRGLTNLDHHALTRTLIDAIDNAAAGSIWKNEADPFVEIGADLWEAILKARDDVRYRFGLSRGRCVERPPFVGRTDEEAAAILRVTYAAPTKPERLSGKITLTIPARCGITGESFVNGDCPTHGANGCASHLGAPPCCRVAHATGDPCGEHDIEPETDDEEAMLDNEAADIEQRIAALNRRRPGYIARLAAGLARGSAK